MPKRSAGMLVPIRFMAALRLAIPPPQLIQFSQSASIQCSPMSAAHRQAHTAAVA